MTSVVSPPRFSFSSKTNCVHQTDVITEFSSIHRGLLSSVICFLSREISLRLLTGKNGLQCIILLLRPAFVHYIHVSGGLHVSSSSTVVYRLVKCDARRFYRLPENSEKCLVDIGERLFHHRGGFALGEDSNGLHFFLRVSLTLSRVILVSSFCNKRRRIIGTVPGESLDQTTQTIAPPSMFPPFCALLDLKWSNDWRRLGSC